MMPEWLAAVLTVLGAAAAAAGVGFIYWPAGVIVAGVLALTAGLLTETAGRPRRDRARGRQAAQTRTR